MPEVGPGAGALEGCLLLHGHPVADQQPGRLIVSPAQQCHGQQPGHFFRANQQHPVPLPVRGQPPVPGAECVFVRPLIARVLTFTLHFISLASNWPILSGNAFMNSSFPLSNGTTSIASGLSSMKLNEGGPIGGSLSSIDWKVHRSLASLVFIFSVLFQRFLDYDGLSKVPTQFEDYIIERDRRVLSAHFDRYL